MKTVMMVLALLLTAFPAFAGMVIGTGAPSNAAWYSVTTSTANYLDIAGSAEMGPVTVTTGGTATKFRVWVNYCAGLTDVKMALYNAGGTTLLASGTTSVASGVSGVYVEVPFSSNATVTTGTSYLIAISASTNNLRIGALNSAGAGGEVTGVPYASFPPATITAAWPAEKLITGAIYVQ